MSSHTLAAQQALGGPEEHAPAKRVRFEQALPPRPQRQAGALSLALGDGAAHQLGELLAQFRLGRGQGVGQPPAKRLAALSRLPSRITRKARSRPMTRGKRCVPPQPGSRPSSTSGRPSCVLGLSKTSR